MTLDDASDPRPPIPLPFQVAGAPPAQPAKDAEEPDRDIFLIPAPPQPVWPRVFPGL